MSGGGFACGLAPLGILEAVIDGVADDVDERIRQTLDDGLVELRLLALGHEFERLSEIAREIVHEAAEARNSEPIGMRRIPMVVSRRPCRQAGDFLRYERGSKYRRCARQSGRGVPA